MGGACAVELKRVFRCVLTSRGCLFRWWRLFVKLSERQFMAMVVDLAKLQRWFVYHTHDSRRSVAGFPDLVLLRPPLAIVAELKVGKNRPTAEQNLWLNIFEECGIPAYVWTPNDWREIETVLT